MSKPTFDKSKEALGDKTLQDVYSQVSTETTSEELDASILQMAKQHHAEEKSVKIGFWNNLFRSNFMKYGVSACFALFMTVGIARLMVHLGKTDQNLNQEVGISSVDLEPEPVAVSLDSSAVEFDAAAQQKSKAERYQEMVAAEKKRIRRPVVAIELSDEAEQIIANSKEASAPKVAQSNEQSELESRPIAANRAAQPRIEASEVGPEYDSGVLDEAVLGYPLPEVWLEEIEQLLLQKDELKVLESWQQFKNTYPDYAVPNVISEQIERLQSIGEKVDFKQD